MYVCVCVWLGSSSPQTEHNLSFLLFSGRHLVMTPNMRPTNQPIDKMSGVDVRTIWMCMWMEYILSRFSVSGTRHQEPRANSANHIPHRPCGGGCKSNRKHFGIHSRLCWGSVSLSFSCSLFIYNIKSVYVAKNLPKPTAICYQVLWIFYLYYTQPQINWKSF